MAKTLRVLTKSGWTTKPSEDLPENKLTAEEVDGNFLALESQQEDKADKVGSPTGGNLAGLDTDGNLTDSGSAPGDFEAAFTKNTAFNKDFGTSTDQVCEGNDTRLSDARAWTATTVTQSEAEAGTATTRRAWTAQRVQQAVSVLAPVQTVAGKTGSVTLDKSDVGLGNVENVALSTATWANMGIATSDVSKSDVGLGNVPNEDATNPANMDQAGASTGQALVWDGSQWGPGSAVGVVSTKSSSYTLSAGDLIHADTSGGEFTLSCPPTPSDGDFIGVRDKASSFATNNLTLDGNGKSILGDSTFIFDVNDQPAEFEFNADRNEWIFARR